MMQLALYQTLVLAWRHYMVWSRNIVTSIALHIMGPIILMYGLGIAFGITDRLSYIVPGITISSVATAAFVSCTYGAMERLFAGRYTSWVSATLTPLQMVLAEALFQSTKVVMIAAGIWIAAALLGMEVNPAAWLLALPIVMLVGAVGGMLGYCLVAVSQSFDDIARFEPMMTAAFVFSGVFVAVTAFPWPLQMFAHLLPIYHGIEIIRPLFTGESMNVGIAFVHIAVLLAMFMGAAMLATKLFRKRLMS